MKKRFALFFPLLFIVAFTMHAQGGCVDSPECPTPVLGLVGAASIAFVTLRTRVSRKN